MVRLAVVLAALCGCNYVLSLDRLDELPPAVCGPYDTPVQVAFSTELAGAHDLSVVGTLGGVVIENTNVPMIVPVMSNPEGTEWKSDGRMPIDRFAGHLVRDASAFGVGIDDSTYVAEFAWSANVWSGIPPTLPPDPCFDMVVGNEYDVVDPVNGPQLRRAVVVKRPNGHTGCTVGKPQLVLVSRQAPFDANHLWTEDQTRTRPINDTELEPAQGVLTEDLHTLVFSADDGFGLDLYVSTLDPNTNNFGTPQRIESLRTPDAEDEPWIDADCSTIWFRRGGVTMMAKKQ